MLRECGGVLAGLVRAEVTLCSYECVDVRALEGLLGADICGG